MILFIDGSITPYSISRYNHLSRYLGEKIVVWYQAANESFRAWKEVPSINYPHVVLKNYKLELRGKDSLIFYWHPALWKQLNRIKNDLSRIVITGWNQPICYVILAWAKKNEIEISLRSGSTVQEKGWLRLITRPLVSWYVRQFDNYLAYGTSSTNYLVSLGAERKRICQYYNTVDTAYFNKEKLRLRSRKSSLRKKMELNQKSFVVLTIGRMVPLKNFSLLIEAFNMFSKRVRKGVQLVILGDGPEMKRLKDQVEASQLEKTVLLPGFIQHQKLSAYYAAADAFILPSTQEIWGLVINEAMASGLPTLISKRVGCIDDLLIEGKTGFSLSPTATDIYQALIKLHRLFLNEPKKYLQMSNNAQKHILNFTIESNINRLKKCWGIG